MSLRKAIGKEFRGDLRVALQVRYYGAYFSSVRRGERNSPEKNLCPHCGEHGHLPRQLVDRLTWAGGSAMLAIAVL